MAVLQKNIWFERERIEQEKKLSQEDFRAMHAPFPCSNSICRAFTLFEFAHFAHDEKNVLGKCMVDSVGKRETGSLIFIHKHENLILAIFHQGLSLVLKVHWRDSQSAIEANLIKSFIALEAHTVCEALWLRIQ